MITYYKDRKSKCKSVECANLHRFHTPPSSSRECDTELFIRLGHWIPTYCNYANISDKDSITSFCFSKHQYEVKCACVVVTDLEIVVKVVARGELRARYPAPPLS